MNHPIQWTEALRETLRAHREAGGTDEQFAARHGMGRDTVRRQRGKMGLCAASHASRPFWTAAEDEVLLSMDAAGETMPAVARALEGRSLAGVWGRLKVLAKLGRRRDALKDAGEASAPAVPSAPAKHEVEPAAEQARTARILRDLPPVRPQRARPRVEPLFASEPRLAVAPARPKLGQDSWPGSVLAGVLIHPAHRRA